MAKIKPFKAVIYNQEKIKDLSRVTCPPYDIISPEAQERYHERCGYNFIHILLGKDIPGEDKYKRAASYFNDWMESGILIEDSSEAVYFYSQEYKIRGEKRTRLGFISLLRLEDKNKTKSVFGHEHTRTEAKEDRLKLMKQVKANLSPIFVVFQDQKRLIQRIYQKYIRAEEPFIDITDDEKTVHKLWRISDDKLLKNIQDGMAEENIFIADGHHRYEVACAYRDQMLEKLGENAVEEAGFNYLLSYFTNTDPRGLSILAIHRLLKLGSPAAITKAGEGFKKYFDIEEVKDKARFFFLMEKGGRTEHLLGMYKDKKYWLLRLKNIKILDKMINDKPPVYRSLDVSILNHLVFKEILGINPDDKEAITFSPDAEELISCVDANPLCAAFFLNPVKVQQIMAVALNGERMPPKSTYFYPKVLSGMVINQFKK